MLAVTPKWCRTPVMEKRRPTYDLDAIKAAIGSIETLTMTGFRTLRRAVTGFHRAGVAAVIPAVLNAQCSTSR
jgi:hypothetical protein